MSEQLERAYARITLPCDDDPNKLLYAGQRIFGCSDHLIGKDREGRACLLIAVVDQPGRLQSPIRLENLDVQFDLRCHLRRDLQQDQVGTFTVVRCRSSDGETVRYFLTVCEVILHVIGDRPQSREVSLAVHRLAAIFQKAEAPPTRPVNGLFGELYLIWRSGDPVAAVAAWRMDEGARFDFSNKNIRLEVKTTSGRRREHIFTYEQCNPPPGTFAVIASMFAERAPGGIGIGSLLEDIGMMLATHSDLLLKLHETVVGTLGASLSEALSIEFDAKVADSSLKFFKLGDIPALRDPLPSGISDVHFRSDLSGCPTTSVHALCDQDPTLKDLLPRE
jgi:hypothetical protein